MRKSYHIKFLAHHVLDYSWWVLLGSAIVAGWMMGIAAWLVTSARDTLSRVLLVALITACIGVLGLHHSIVGNIEVFSGVLFGDTSILDYIRFLLLALIGNTIGGVVFVTVLKFGSLKYDIKKLKEDSLEEIEADR
ncbi:formate/nitrite transporter family protein [Psychrobacter pasteurii]|nr:formate/nitrite transporter family protein [Psychrobacter pasteurii]